MRTIYGVVTFLAAIIVLFFGANWAVTKYQVIDPIVEKSAANEGDKTEKPKVGIPAAGSFEIQTNIDEFLRDASHGPSDERPHYLPVYAERAPRHSSFFWSSSGRRGVRWQMGGGCSGFYDGVVVNIVRWDTRDADTKTVFKSRVFLPIYGVLTSETDERLVALVVRDDSNGDGYLSCDDLAKFEIRSFDTNEATVVDLNVLPSQVILEGLDTDGDALVFIEAFEDAGAPVVKLRKLHLVTGEITEIQTPDVLSEAAAAIADGGDNEQ